MFIRKLDSVEHKVADTPSTPLLSLAADGAPMAFAAKQSAGRRDDYLVSHADTPPEEEQMN